MEFSSRQTAEAVQENFYLHQMKIIYNFYPTKRSLGLKMTHSFRSHYFHLIWSTKERKECITKAIQTRLYAYMGGIIKTHGCSLLQVGGTGNHVHLLIVVSSLDKFIPLIRELKAKSSLWVNKNFPDQQPFAWQEGYGSFSVSYSAHQSVIHYIQRQEEHHKTLSFEEEFLRLLKKHNLEYDYRFVLG